VLTVGRDRLRADVVVVGAGLSGLVAARRLRAAGLSVCVLEARAQAGGRVERLPGPGGVGYDGGGQFVDDPQHRVVALADELGLARAELWTAGQFVRIRDGARSIAGGDGAEDPHTATEQHGALRQITDLAAELSPETPWAHPCAGEWDSVTFRTWTEANIPSPLVRDAVESLLMPTGPPTDVSLLHVLAWVRGHGDADNLHTTERYLVPGGTFQIPERLAADLGDVLHNGTAVRTIAQRASAVHVGSDRVDVDAQAAIVALAPPLIERIEFTPDLPPRRRLLQRRWVQMPSIKSIAIYETPWWRDRGFNGQAVTDLPVAPFIVDVSGPRGGPGVLVSFTNLCRRPPAWVLDDARRRREHFLVSVSTAFGPQAPAPVGYLEGNWFGRRWTAGCGQMLQCGVLSSLGDVLRPPVGRVVWAGTEVANGYAGYMEGAVRAGEDAAREAARLVAGAPLQLSRPDRL
jgi:monoamine oxidase